MSADWVKYQPENRNYLSPTGFILNLEMFPGVDFFCQRANLPAISMPTIDVPTRFRTYPIAPGGGVEYEDLNLTFIIDEDLKNYWSVWHWIRKNGGSEGYSGEALEYSKGNLAVLSSNYNPKFFIDFDYIFPYRLSPIEFDASVENIEYFIAQVSFRYFGVNIRDENFQPVNYEV
jgi:hypothetical protein